jgi:hypothetical protein
MVEGKPLPSILNVAGIKPRHIFLGYTSPLGRGCPTTISLTAFGFFT